MCQLIYWKYITGEWIVYSYQDQGFDWLTPHIDMGLWHYRNGWLVYTPIMIFALIGFFWLYKKDRSLFSFSLLYILIFIYVAFSWSIWWYGGSLGQRTMIQAYPVLMLPFAAFIEYLKTSRKWITFIIGGVMVMFCYLNLWFTHQAHKGGLLLTEQMTKAYYWRVLGRFERNPEDLKLLDTDEDFSGEPRDLHEVFNSNVYEGIPDSSLCEWNYKDESIRGICLSAFHPYSPEMKFSIPDDSEWLRASADFASQTAEWGWWRSTQFIVRFYQENEVVKTRFIRVFRFLGDQDYQNLYFDTKVPSERVDSVSILFWHADIQRELLIRNIKAEVFDEG